MNTTNHPNLASVYRSSAHVSGASSALWASAVVVIALIIVQAGRLPGNQAQAATQADRGAYTLLTASSGNGPESNPNELLFVMDSREQVLLVYEIEDAHKKSITLRDGGPLDNMFIRARQ